MTIVNATATEVPYGPYAGMDLQQFATEHTYDARELMKESKLRIEYADHYQDLGFYLDGVRKARRFMRGH